MTCDLADRAVLPSRRVLPARFVPEVENSDSLLLRQQVVVAVKRRMEKSKYARISLHGRSQTGKAPEPVFVVEKRGPKPLRGSRMLFPRPIEHLFKVSYGRVRVENLEIHCGNSFRTSSLETTRPSLAS